MLFYMPMTSELDDLSISMNNSQEEGVAVSGSIVFFEYIPSARLE